MYRQKRQYKKRYNKKSKVPAKTKKDALQDREIKQIRSMVRPEMKYLDTSPATFATVPAGSAFSLNLISQGVNISNRLGNAIYAKYVRIHGETVVVANGGSDRLMRLQLVWDKVPAGAVPTPYGATSTGTTAVNDSTNLGSAPNIFAPHSLEYKNRYSIIYDKIHRIILNDQAAQIIFHWSITMRLNRKIRYDATTATIGSVSTNNLSLLVSLDITPVAAVNTSFTARMYYTDE